MNTTATGPANDAVETLTLPARTVMGMREHVAAAELPDFFARAIPAVTRELAHCGAVPAGPPVAVYSHEVERAFDVTVGFPVAGGTTATGGLVAEELPAGRAVSAEHLGSYETLPDAYAALGRWFGDHALNPPEIMWEEYLVGPGTAGESGYRTRIVCPLG
ncbi:GyrI-like domain-containing protein [Krasilnikovia sp. MM14-A1004]|uniref:GyrI-like domain-containing protein n=1 Tax=Krasilnikovia sp. MM14-A1004 TaxID=3373541 RepID=UPI00399D3302